MPLLKFEPSYLPVSLTVINYLVEVAAIMELRGSKWFQDLGLLGCDTLSLGEWFTDVSKNLSSFQLKGSNSPTTLESVVQSMQHHIKEGLNIQEHRYEIIAG